MQHAAVRVDRLDERKQIAGRIVTEESVDHQKCTSRLSFAGCVMTLIILDYIGRNRLGSAEMYLSADR